MEKTESKIWFLRAGDFRPEEVTPENMRYTFGEYVTYGRAIEWLSQSNNLFPNKQTAEEASLTVRSFLASFAIVRSEPVRSASRTQRLSHNTVRQSASACVQIPCMEIRIHCGRPQAPNA